MLSSKTCAFFVATAVIARLGGVLAPTTAMMAYACLFPLTVLLLVRVAGEGPVKALLRDFALMGIFSITVGYPIYGSIVGWSAWRTMLVLLLAVFSSVTLMAIYLTSTPLAAILRASILPPRAKVALAIIFTYAAVFEEDIRSSVMAYRSLGGTSPSGLYPWKAWSRYSVIIVATIWHILDERSVSVYLSALQTFATDKEV